VFLPARLTAAMALMPWQPQQPPGMEHLTAVMMLPSAVIAAVLIWLLIRARPAFAATS